MLKMEKVRIDEVYPKTHYNTILNFQNAYPTDKFSSKTCALLEDNISGDKTIICEINDMLYAGTEQKNELTKTVILARDKITGKVRLIEMGVMDMKPVLNVNTDANTTLDTSSLELSRKFGSKKHKKIMEQREKFKVNKQTVSEQMHNVTVNIAEDKLDLSSYIKTDSYDFYIPPIDRTATKVEDVYDIYKILTEEQYQKIYSELESKDYVSDIVPFMKELVTKDLKKEHKVLAVYASYLFKFFMTMTKEIAKKTFVMCEHSATLNDIIINNFTTMSNNRRNRSLQLKDKSLCHGIVCLLIINNFKYDADELCKNVKMALRTLTTKVRVVGATMVTSGDKKTVQLKLPLANAGLMRRKSAKF